MTRAEAYERALDIRREMLRFRREMSAAGMHTEAEMANEIATAFDPLLRQTYEGETRVFACKR